MTEFLQQLINGLAWGSIYALIALGYTMVYGVLKFINFAHGDVYMVGAYLAYYVGCALVGFLIERLAYRPLRNAQRLSVLITAIGVSLLLENGGQRLFGADP